ncbi:hypothetical protein J1N51_03565 [Psychrosphaera ytuae]|uniref:YtxH domain-containing protein n=1 Tax=Psychrosphaera ytuae TaxID=2820710 RepID=A0A975HIS5_9GAMM|nr:hypothetical protein [Psychrosphaera ytuae]QTH64560.1 hypothetical protein J1N51_03565 [Psychrosphaera ytuae]
MKTFKLLLMTLPLVFSASFLTACGDGEAEEAGEKVDEVLTDAGNAVEDACEEVKEKADAKDTDC